MKKLLMLAALAAIAAGCSVTKINYEKDDKGTVSYRIYHNDHWLKRDTGAMSGGMAQDGKFEVKLERATASPSEEFNRTMQTYTTAFVQLAQIVAAAYNPSASAATSTVPPTSSPSAREASSTAPAATTNAVDSADCPDCVVK